MPRYRTGTVEAYVEVDIDDLLAEIAERNLSTRSALLAAVEAEHAENHPWGPTWLCRAGACGRIDWQEQS